MVFSIVQHHAKDDLNNNFTKIIVYLLSIIFVSFI